MVAVMRTCQIIAVFHIVGVLALASCQSSGNRTCQVDGFASADDVSALVSAAASGNLGELQRANKQMLPVVVDADGMGLIHVAAKNRHVDVVRYLIDSGVSTKSRDASGKPPVYYAIQNADHRMIQLLLPSVSGRGDEMLMKAAIKSGDVKTLDMLIREGVSPKTKLSYWTKKNFSFQPIHYAASMDKVGVVQYLSSIGVSLTDKDQEWRDGLDWAIRCESEVLLQDLIERGLLDPSSPEYLYRRKVHLGPLHLAVYYRDLQLVEQLISLYPSLVQEKDFQGALPAYYLNSRGLLEKEEIERHRKGAIGIIKESKEPDREAEVSLKIRQLLGSVDTPLNKPNNQ